jgi:hypothetical protein
MLTFIHSEDLSSRGHHLDFEHLVSSKPAGRAHCAMPAASKISTYSNAPSPSRNDCEISQAGFVIDFEHLLACCSSDSGYVNGISTSLRFEAIVE